MLGVNETLEPAMTWDKFLLGPLGDEERRLVEAFGLAAEPFAGLNLTVLFCNPSVASWRPRRRQAVPGYHEEFTSSCNDNSAGLPDLAMALHPGLAKYPEMWQPTLIRLHRQGVPIIVCDTGDTSGLFFEFDDHLAPAVSGQALHLPGDWNFLRDDRQFFTTGRFPGGHGEQRFVDQAQTFFVNGDHQAVTAHELGSLWRMTYYATDGRYLWKGSNFTGLPGFGEPSARPWTGGTSTEEWPMVCSDSEGTLYMARQHGFAVALMTKSPFHYCEEFPLCQSSRIVSLLEPLSDVDPAAAASELRYGLFSELVQKALPCYSQDIQLCLKERLSVLIADASARDRVPRQHTVDGYLKPCSE